MSSSVEYSVVLSDNAVSFLHKQCPDVPLGKNIELLIADYLQYRAEVPIAQHLEWQCNNLLLCMLLGGHFRGEHRDI